MMNKVVIDGSGIFKRNVSAQGTKIYLNGEELHGVTKISVDFSVDSLPTVTMTILAQVTCVSPNYDEE